MTSPVLLAQDGPAGPELPGPSDTPAPSLSAPLNLEAPSDAYDGDGMTDPAPFVGDESLVVDGEFVPQWPLETTEQGISSPDGFVTSPAPCGCNAASHCGIGPRSPRPVMGFHCVGDRCGCGVAGGDVWDQAGPIPWQAFGPGEYVGPARRSHVGDYHVRVDDVIEFVFRVTGQAVAEGYRLRVGDELDLACGDSDRQNLVVRPNGAMHVGQIGEVQAAGRSMSAVQHEMEIRLANATSERPCVTLLPRRLSHVFQDNGAGSWPEMKSRTAQVSPAGDVQLPVVGSVAAQGLTLGELKREVEAAYRSAIGEVEVTPILAKRAERYVYVVGEVAQTGRYSLKGPTTLMQAITLAGGPARSADLKQVIVFRRDENWNLMATRINIACAMQGP